MVKLNFHDDPAAAKAIVLSARQVKAGEIVSGIVGISEPYTLKRKDKNGREVDVKFVNIQIKEVTVLDEELVNDMLQAYGAKLNTMPLNSYPALLALTQVGAFRERLDTVELRSGMTANFTVGSRNHAMTVVGSDALARIGLACKQLGVQEEKVLVASFVGVDRIETVANRSIYQQARTKLKVNVPSTGTPPQAPTMRLLTDDEKDALTTEQIKSYVGVANYKVKSDGTPTAATLKLLDKIMVPE